MLRIYAIACVSLVAVVAAGCGSRELPFTDNSRDSEAYAVDVRTVVLDHVVVVQAKK